MKIDLAQTHNWIVTELGRRRPVAESMNSIIDQCEVANPHPDWSHLRLLHYADLSLLRVWLQRPFREEPPRRPLCGLWFGLFNPIRDDRITVADIYVCGSERFHADPVSNSWAVGPDWWPADRYAESEVLAEIYRIAYRHDSPIGERKDALKNDAEYPLCLGYAAFAMRDLLGQIEPSLILGESDSLGVAVGFDSGDFVLLGRLTVQGLIPIDHETEPRELALATVLEGLRSADNEKVFQAMQDVHQLGNHAVQTLTELIRIASLLEQNTLRGLAVNLLVAVDPDDPSVKTTVMRAIKDSSPFVRREALQAMISIKKLTPDDLVRIKNMEKDSDKDVARWSEIALRNISLRNVGAS